jgi:hypothetical protein
MRSITLCGALAVCASLLAGCSPPETTDETPAYEKCNPKDPESCVGGPAGGDSPSPAYSPAAPASAGIMHAGEGLTWGHTSLYSGDGRAQLVLQPDGNLVYYVDGRAMWSSNTSTGSNAFDPVNTGQALVMQSNGDLVLYTYSGRALWRSGTSGYPGAFLILSIYYLEMMQGNLVLWNY